MGEVACQSFAAVMNGIVLRTQQGTVASAVFKHYSIIIFFACPILKRLTFKSWVNFRMAIKAQAPETAEVFEYLNLHLYFNKQTERTHKVVGRL